MEESFAGVLTFSFMVFIIWLGALLRRRFRLLQLSLLPASIIGGLLGFFLLNLGWTPSNQNSEDFVVFAFHFFTLSFMSLALTRESASERDPRSRSTNKLGALWLSVAWTVSLAMQALVGLLGISLANHFSEQTLPQSLGILVTHGFTQGPGQALAMGSIWQEQYSVQDAVNFGLIYASVGFIIAFVVGIPIARWALRKNLNENKQVSLSQEFVIGFYRSENRPKQVEILLILRT